MDLRQMEYFTTVCDCGGITPAAEALFLTPQALSKAIRKLEEELNCPLLARGKGGSFLTPFGEKALEEMRHLIEEHHSAEARLGQMAAQERGFIRLACGWGVPNALPLDELRQELLEEGIRLDVIELPDLAAEEMVQHEAVDLGLTVGLPKFPELFHCTFLRRFYLCAVLNVCHPLAQKKAIAIRDLAGEKVITKSPYFKSYHLMEEEAARQGIRLSYALKSPDELRFVRLIESNQGVGVGVSFMEGNEKVQISSSAVCLPFVENLPWEIYLTIRKGHYLSPSAQVLTARLKS